MGTTREMGGGQGAQMTAAVAGGLTPAAVRAGAPMLVRGLMRGGETGRTNMVDRLNDFRLAHTTPSVAQATQGRIAQAAESLLGFLPGSAGVIARKATTQGEEIGAGVRGMADEVAPGADAESAGRAIRQGIVGPGGFQERTRGVTDRLYANLDAQIPDGSRVGVSNTGNILDQLNPEIAGAPSLTPFFQNARLGGIKSGFAADTAGTGSLMTRPGVSEWADDMRQALQERADDIGRQNVLRTSSGLRPLRVPSAADIDAQIQGQLQAMVDGRLPYEAVRKTRTMVGNEINNANFASDVPTGDWRRLYGGLTGDMRTAAADAGPTATQAFNRANSHFRAVDGRSDAIKHVVNRDTPEKIFAAATAGTKEGATTLRALMRSLPEGSQREVASAVLARMGRSNSGQQNAAGDAFSTQTFLTNWDSLGPQARGALFNRLGPEFQARVEAITRVADNLRKGSKVYSNPSGTAPAQALIAGSTAIGTAGLTGNFGAAGLGLAGMGVTNLGARVMTSPRAPAWLARKTPIPYSGLIPLSYLNAAALAEQEKQRKAKSGQK